MLMESKEEKKCWLCQKSPATEQVGTAFANEGLCKECVEAAEEIRTRTEAEIAVVNQELMAAIESFSHVANARGEQETGVSTT
jgi:hypothetical protein